MGTNAQAIKPAQGKSRTHRGHGSWAQKGNAAHDVDKAR